MAAQNTSRCGGTDAWNAHSKFWNTLFCVRFHNFWARWNLTDNFRGKDGWLDAQCSVEHIIKLENIKMELAFQILELHILRLIQQFVIQVKPDKQFQGQIWMVRGAMTVRTLHFVVEQKWNARSKFWKITFCIRFNYFWARWMLTDISRGKFGW